MRRFSSLNGALDGQDAPPFMPSPPAAPPGSGAVKYKPILLRESIPPTDAAVQLHDRAHGRARWRGWPHRNGALTRRASFARHATDGSPWSRRGLEFGSHLEVVNAFDCTSPIAGPRARILTGAANVRCRRSSSSGNVALARDAGFSHRHRGHSCRSFQARPRRSQGWAQITRPRLVRSRAPPQAAVRGARVTRRPAADRGVESYEVRRGRRSESFISDPLDFDR